MHTRTAKDSQNRHGCSNGVLLRAVVAVTVTWTESPHRGTWVAELDGTVLAVTRLGLDQWQPAAGDARGPVYRTRLEAQREAEKLARPGKARRGRDGGQS
jgi:hypothetical protein